MHKSTPVEKLELPLHAKFERLQTAFKAIFSGTFKFYYYRREEGKNQDKKPRIAVCVAHEKEIDRFERSALNHKGKTLTGPPFPDADIYHRGISVCAFPDNPEKLEGKYRALRRLYRAIKQEKDKVVHISQVAEEVIGSVVGDDLISNLHPIIFRTDWDLTHGFEDDNFYAFGTFRTQPTEFEKKLLAKRKQTSKTNS